MIYATAGTCLASPATTALWPGTALDTEKQGEPTYDKTEVGVIVFRTETQRKPFLFRNSVFELYGYGFSRILLYASGWHFQFLAFFKRDLAFFC